MTDKQWLKEARKAMAVATRQLIADKESKSVRDAWIRAKRESTAAELAVITGGRAMSYAFWVSETND